VTPDVAQASRLHGLGIDHPFLVPTRCVGTWKLRAAESIGPVSSIRIRGSQTCRLSGVIRCGPEVVCADPCRQLVMESVSRLEDGGPSWTGTTRHLVGPWDYRYFVGPSGYQVKPAMPSCRSNWSSVRLSFPVPMRRVGTGYRERGFCDTLPAREEGVAKGDTRRSADVSSAWLEDKPPFPGASSD